MATLAQATSVALADIGYERTPPPSAGTGAFAPPSTGGALRRGLTAPIGNSPVLGATPVRGLPRLQVAAVPPLSDAAFQGSGDSTVTEVAFASGGGGSSGTVVETTTLLSTNTAITTPVLSQNETFTTPVQLGRTFAVFQVSVSAPARVQLYSSAAAQTADAGRPITTAPTYGLATGLILDLNLLQANESAWALTPIAVGANTEQPRNPSAYLTVTNIVPSSTPITVTIFYLPLES